MTQTQARTPPRYRQDRGPAPRLEPKASVRLTGRGAIIVLFALCFGAQLMAVWVGWGPLAGAAFVCACGAVTYYTRTSGLRALVVAPPLVFLVTCGLADVLTQSGVFLAAEQALVTLGTLCPWLFTGTALAVVVAIGRGYQPVLLRLSASRARGLRRR